MDSSRFNNTNGERNGRATTKEENNPAYRRGSSSSQSQPSHQLPPETRHRGHDEELFNFPGCVDLQTLESSFGGLSLLDSSVRGQQNPPPLDRNRWTNRSSSVINGGGAYWSRHPPPPAPPANSTLREVESQLLMNQYLQRLAFQNDCVNGRGSFGYDAGQSSSSGGGVMLNNGFQNGNSRDVPFFSRNRFVDQSPWGSTNGFGSGIDNFTNSFDPILSQENARGSSTVFMAKDKVLSENLLENIAVGSKEMIDMYFNDVIVQICDLMVDPFGHHVVAKLMQKCSPEQINQILDIVTLQHYHRFVTICFDPLGTRAIQSLMKYLHSEDQILRIVEAVRMVALTLSRSNNGKHVILQCFILFPPSHYRNLLEVIARNCYDLAIDQHGCCMLQQCLDLNRAEINQRLIHEIITNALRLCLNCYGNYVVQYIVELEDRNVTLELVRQLSGNYAYLSRNKYGSHAVQKLLKIRYIDPNLIINDLLGEINTLLLDPFGNYVIQTALYVCKEDMRQLLKWHIERNKRLMRCNKFGNKILEKFNL